MGIAISCCKGQVICKKNQRLSNISAKIKTKLIEESNKQDSRFSKCQNYIQIHRKSLFNIKEEAASLELSKKGSLIC